MSISAIAGPSIADEVSVHRHTSVVFTGEDPEVLTRWREIFATEHYHVWTNTDLVGVEMCAATKNCYAFGTGFMQGLLDAMGEAAIVVIGKAMARLTERGIVPPRGSRCCVTSTRWLVWTSPWPSPGTASSAATAPARPRS